MDNCVICGRPLKTGRKYCYVCRSQQHAKSLKECKYCGKKVKIVASCQFVGFLGSKCVPWNFSLKAVKREPTSLCEECAKKCEKCGKYYCPKHIGNHKCI